MAYFHIDILFGEVFPLLLAIQTIAKPGHEHEYHCPFVGFIAMEIHLGSQRVGKRHQVSFDKLEHRIADQSVQFFVSLRHLQINLGVYKSE